MSGQGSRREKTQVSIQTEVQHESQGKTKQQRTNSKRKSTNTRGIYTRREQNHRVHVQQRRDPRKTQQQESGEVDMTSIGAVRTQAAAKKRIIFTHLYGRVGGIGRGTGHEAPVVDAFGESLPAEQHGRIRTQDPGQKHGTAAPRKAYNTIHTSTA
eukprot:2765412-Rhodomonas_salina.1